MTRLLILSLALVLNLHAQIFGTQHRIPVSVGGGTVATPTDSPGQGTYTSTQSVTLSDATAGATICFTTDNSTPTAPTAGSCGGAPTQTYTGAITVSATTTIKAIGTKPGMSNSALLTSVYTINGLITMLDHKTAQNTGSCAGGQAPGSCTTPALNCGTSAGTAYFLAISYFDTGDPTSVTSSDGHTFTTAPPSAWVNSTDASRVRQYYVLNVTGSSSVTFSASGYYQSMYAACALAPPGKTWSLDKDVGASNTGDNTATIQGTSTGTLTLGGELILMSVFWDSRGSGSTPPAGVPGSVNSGFTVLDANDILVSPLSLGGGLAYKIKSSGDTTAENPTWTMSVGGRTATGMTTYKVN